MFGLLYTLFVGGAHVVKGIKDTIENEEFKQKYRDDESGIYYDNKMRKHDQTTGRIVVYQKDPKTKDMWVVDAENCQKLRNLTQNTIENHYKEERNKFLNGTTAKTYVKYGNDEHRKDKCKGGRVKDLKTGKLYVLRQIDRDGFDEYFRKVQLYPIGVTLLMDIETGEFIRPADCSLIHSVGDAEKIQLKYEIMKKENEKKKKEVEKYEKLKDNSPMDYETYIMYKYSNHLTDYNPLELLDNQNEFLVSRGKRLI